ncbi:TcpQ domain-containing protein [Leptospirillum ferriphilum]|uniref:TcpQ domain-containing protein n=1 Tax=Leptospirillum ferriphilum TaxID=178606 RepID=UPI0006B1B736|nr:TcpQ domain-containing protein [Leptospirillum ferriphilum]
MAIANRKYIVFGSVFLFFMVSFITTSSFAYFDVGGPEARRDKNGQIVHVDGFFQKNANMYSEKFISKPFSGFGNHEQFQDALRTIMGSQWTIEYGGISPRMPITWKSAGMRSKTMDKIAKLYGIVIDLDWLSRTIKIYRTGFRGSMTVLKNGARELLFRTDPALSLKDNIETWGNRSKPHWKVIWQSHWNYRIRFAQDFTDNFEKSVETLIRSANKTGGSHYVVDFYANNVVVVRDR